MISRKFGSQASRWQPSVLLLGLALVGALAATGQAGAQMLPYQSRQRATIGTGLGKVDPPRGLFVEPRIEAAVQYANNINLAETSQAQDNAFGLELAPGIYASYFSDHFMGIVDYSLVARAWDDSTYDDISHRLDANGRWTAIQDLLYVDGGATYGDKVIDANQGLNYGNLGVFGQNNLTEEATARVAPTLIRRFRIFKFEATYSYGRVWYLDSSKGQAPTTIAVLSNDDSVNQSVNLRFGTERDERKLNGGVFYEWDRTDFDRALPYQYERAGFDARYQLTRTLSMVGDVGKESALDVSTTEGGLDSSFWSAGLNWTPDSRTSAEGRVGERFFGNSYSGTLKHHARLVDITASYVEEPDVQSRSLAIGETGPGGLPPGTDPGIDGGRLNAQPYVGKDARILAVAKGARTIATLDVYDTHRDYLRNVFGDEHFTGASLTGTRRMFANFSVDATAAYADIQHDATTDVIGPVAASHDYDTQFILRGNRDFGPKLTASLETGYLHRSGTSNYDGWWVGLRGRWIPTLR